MRSVVAEVVEYCVAWTFKNYMYDTRRKYCTWPIFLIYAQNKFSDGKKTDRIQLQIDRHAIEPGAINGFV